MNQDLSLGLVEVELERKRYFEDFTGELFREYFESHNVDFNYFIQMIFRYILNKNITKTQEDDPVFITSSSVIGIKQIIQDFDYLKNKNKKLKITPKEFIEVLEENLLECSKHMKEFKPKHIGVVKKDKDYLIYILNRNSFRLYDISNLGVVDPYSAYALNIRYNYLNLKAHGLARTFKENGYGPDDAAEGFGSSFNHYFNEYCSAFEDLEAVFGSRGSFFRIQKWNHDIVFVNPPFDVELMSEAIYKVFRDSERMSNRFIFTIPNWTDMKALVELKEFKYTIGFKVYKKGELPFIDYMKDPKKYIYPCDILEVVVENPTISKN